MCDGEISAYFEDSSKVTEDELGEYMLGINKMSKEACKMRKKGVLSHLSTKQPNF